MSYLRPYPHPSYINFPILFHPSMSTASIVTALAVRDLTLDDENDIVNHMCILAATQGKGTLFHSNSFQEEDIVELCIGLGQAHPEDVLQLSDTKMVLAF